MPLSDTSEAPINDAQVLLVEKGVTYTLVASGDSPYYEYPGADLFVEAGDTFVIEVTYLGAVATGETVVPNPPVAVRLDRGTLWVPEFGFGGGRPGGGFNQENSQIAASWEDPDRLLHYMVIESRDDSAFFEVVRDST